MPWHHTNQPRRRAWFVDFAEAMYQRVHLFHQLYANNKASTPNVYSMKPNLLHYPMRQENWLIKRSNQKKLFISILLDIALYHLLNRVQLIDRHHQQLPI